MMRQVVCAAAWVMLLVGPAQAQSITVDLTQSVGSSTDELAAAGTQVRALGDLGAGVRYLGEAAWGGRTSDHYDAFATAYPYDGSLQVIEAYVERTFRPAGGLVAVRGGRYRTPFGISASSDHAYVGFLRAPLVRYDDYFALSNTFLEHGIDVLAGSPGLSLEGSLSAPADVGEAERPQGLDVVLRGQAFSGPVIFGVSYLRTRPYQSPLFAHGHAEFGGVDARWMRDGVEVRGEWIAGRPFDGARTTGGYADVIVHRPAMRNVTALLRLERLDYDAVPPFSFVATRVTGGARVRLRDDLAVSLGLLRHASNEPGEERRLAFDAGMTYVLRVP